MSATITTPVFTPSGHNLSFGGMLRSEWLKLRSIRSTWWAYGILALLTIGLGAQMSAELNFYGIEGPIPPEAIQAAGVHTVLLSTDFSSLVVSVLGVLIIAGEYGTGMIRSTLIAVPRRVPALLAKAIVFAVVTFIVVALAVAVTVPISVGLLSANGFTVDLGDVHYWLALLGGVAYLVFVGLIAFTIGAIVRNTAAGIAVSLGLSFVAPLILSLIGGISPQPWMRNIGSLLPASAGDVLFNHPDYQAFASPGSPPEALPDGVWALEPWHGALILVAWVAVLLTTAVVLLKRRDA